MNNHLRINKPIFFKKIRIYNDLYKQEELGLTYEAPKMNHIVVKSSFIEQVLDICALKYSFFYSKGGKFYFTKLYQTNKEGFYILNKNLFKINSDLLFSIRDKNKQISYFRAIVLAMTNVIIIFKLFYFLKTIVKLKFFKSHDF